MKYTNYAKHTNLTMEEFSSLMGSSGANVSKSNALKNSDVIFACVNYISSTIAKMPLNLYKNTDNGKEKVDNELINLVKSRPNYMMTYTDFISALVANMLVYGNGYAKIITRNGKINELQLLDSNVTTLEKINNKWYVKTKIDDKDEVLAYNQVIHLKDLSDDGIHGISRVEVIKNKASNRMNGDKKLETYFGEGNQTLKGIIIAPTDDNGAKRKIKDSFNNILKSNNDGVAVLSEGFDYKNIPSSSLLDMDFVNSMNLTKADICAVFAINPALIGLSDKATNSNMTVMVEDFVKSLQPIVNKLEGEFTYKLLSQTDKLKMYFKLNMTSVLRGNDLERADYYAKMIQNGLMSINYVMDLEDMNHVEGGDERYRSLNYVPLSIANEYQLSKAGVE